jgi:hypothetical protein
MTQDYGEGVLKRTGRFQCDDCQYRVDCAEFEDVCILEEANGIVAEAKRKNIDPLYIGPKKPPRPRTIITIVILVIACSIAAAVSFFGTDDLSEIAVVDVMEVPEETQSFWLDEGEYEVWHEEDTPHGTVTIRSSSKELYFSSDTGSGGTSDLYGIKGYRKLGTFEADEGNYTLYQRVDSHIIITEPTLRFEAAVITGLLILFTFIYVIYVYARYERG